MTNNGSAAKPVERELTITRVFNAPRELVFKAWTDPKHVLQWWCPNYFTNTKCEMDVRPGGDFLVVMADPNGTEYPSKGTFREVVPPERLVFTQVALEDESGTAHMEGLTTVTFEDYQGKTKLTLHVTMVNVADDALWALAGMNDGWNQSLDKLSEEVDRMVESNGTGEVMLGISMSLDGFVAGPNDEVDELFKWYFNGDVEIPVQEGRMTLKVSAKSAEMLKGAFTGGGMGAMVTGRRNFDNAKAWGGHPPFVPTIVLTHHIPQEWVKEGSPFIFVTDGIESAIRQAKQAAGDKGIAVATPSITQQCLKAGLLDGIHIDLVPVLLGRGIRLFDYLGIEPVQLEITNVIDAPYVTHLTYKVIK